MFLIWLRLVETLREGGNNSTLKASSNMALCANLLAMIEDRLIHVRPAAIN